MDGRGGCCIARYTGNMYDMSKIDRIMLRYRPIAPKPATNSSGSGSSTTENSTAYVKTGRGKRRYVRNNSSKKMDNTGNGSVTKRCKRRKKKKSSSPPEENESNGRSTVSTGSVSGGDGIVTLPLLQETPEKKEEDDAQESPAEGACPPHAPLWLDFGGSHPQQDGIAGLVAQKPVRVLETWVVVECITEMDVYGGGGGGGVGLSDEEKLMNMERDTCPGFITDGWNRLIWVNRAYKEMILGKEEEEMVVLVKLLMKDDGVESPPANWPGFTCRVRVVTCGKVKSSSVVKLPCDVWRLGGSGGQGFAWRLDTKAALSLGR